MKSKGVAGMIQVSDNWAMKTMCSNPECPKHTEYSGGEFRLVNDQWYCRECSRSAGASATCKNLWNFTTTHFTGRPIEVKDRNHLDRLCKEHGVSNFARENYERSW